MDNYDNLLKEIMYEFQHKLNIKVGNEKTVYISAKEMEEAICIPLKLYEENKLGHCSERGQKLAWDNPTIYE